MPDDNIRTHAKRRSPILIRLWRGEEALWKAYWLIGVLGGWAVQTVAANLVSFEIVPVLPAVGGALIYAVYVFVAIWRCAFNADRRIWGYLARAVLVALPLFSVVEILFGDG